jgi:hypothetical protein
MWSPAMTEVPRVGRGRTVQVGGEVVDEEETAAGFGVGGGVGEQGLSATGVGDGEPVVAVGGPQDELDHLVLLGPGAVSDGVGEQLAGEQPEVVPKVGPQRVREGLGDGPPGAGDGGGVCGEAPQGGHEGDVGHGELRCEGGVFVFRRWHAALVAGTPVPGRTGTLARCASGIAVRSVALY